MLKRERIRDLPVLVCGIFLFFVAVVFGTGLQAGEYELPYLLEFDGSGDYVDLPVRPRDIEEEGVTFSCWIKIAPEAGSDRMKIFSGYSGRGGDKRWDFEYSRDGGDRKLWFNEWGGAEDQAGSRALEEDTWYFVSFVWKPGEEVTIYIDGEEDASFSIEQTTLDDGVNFRLAGRPDGSEKEWEGAIRDVMLWQSARTEEELKYDMQTPPTGDEQGLVGYWPLNEDEGETVYDRSENENHGQIVGAAWNIKKAEVLSEERQDVLDALKEAARDHSSPRVRREAIRIMAQMDPKAELWASLLLDILSEPELTGGFRFEVLSTIRGAGPELLGELADDQAALEALSAIVLDEDIEVSHRLMAFQIHPEPDEEMRRAKPIPAFPGAEGAGKYTPGGRGGDVYVVENTESEGPGSLRYGIETADGPRTIVFNTQGTIRFEGNLMLEEENRITIAGQTAPGDGITLRFDDGGLRVIDSEDIIIQHLRLADGDSGTENDVLRTDRSKRVMLSHLSVRWGARGNWVVRPDGPLTLQYSINAEPTNRQLGGWFGHMREDEGHFTHTINKNMGIHQGGRINMFQRGGFEFMNNLTFNATPRRASLGPYYIMSRPWHGTASSDLGPQLVEVNALGNVMIDGRNPPAYTFGFGRASRVFIDGNVRDRNPDLPFSPEPADGDIIDGAPRSGPRGDEFELVDQLLDLDLREAQGLVIEEQRTSPLDARRAYIDVLSRSGASAFRDVHDHRYVRDVMNKNTRDLPNSLNDIPGEAFPEPDPDFFEPWVSTAGDGIPDAWKEKHGLDPETEYHQEYTEEGYTYLEKYLHSLAPHSFHPDPSDTEEIQIGSSYGDGGTGAVSLEEKVSCGLLRFDLSQVEPGMLNDASLQMNFGDMQGPAEFRVYALDHDRDRQRWGSGTIGPEDAPAVVVEDGEASLKRDELVLLGNIELEEENGSEVSFDNPNLAVFLNLAVYYAGTQPDHSLVTLLLEPTQPDEVNFNFGVEAEPRLVLEAVSASEKD